MIFFLITTLTSTDENNEPVVNMEAWKKFGAEVFNKFGKLNNREFQVKLLEIINERLVKAKREPIKELHLSATELHEVYNKGKKYLEELKEAAKKESENKSSYLELEQSVIKNIKMKNENTSNEVKENRTKQNIISKVGTRYSIIKKAISGLFSYTTLAVLILVAICIYSFFIYKPLPLLNENEKNFIINGIDVNLRYVGNSMAYNMKGASKDFNKEKLDFLFLSDQEFLITILETDIDKINFDSEFKLYGTIKLTKEQFKEISKVKIEY